jgi:hypothetical protein
MNIVKHNKHLRFKISKAIKEMTPSELKKLEIFFFKRKSKTLINELCISKNTLFFC